MSVTNGYCTLAELRTHLGDTNTELSTELLERAINVTSRAIDKFCGRRFWLDTTVESRVYRPDHPFEAWVDDIGTTTGLVVKTDTTGDGTWATTWDAADYQLEPLNADMADAAYAWWRIVAVDDKTFPVDDYRTTLQVTAKFGWSAVPDEIAEACLLRASAVFKRKDSPMGFSNVGEFGPVRISRQMDPDVAALLSPYQRQYLGAV